MHRAQSHLRLQPARARGPLTSGTSLLEFRCKCPCAFLKTPHKWRLAEKRDRARESLTGGKEDKSLVTIILGKRSQTLGYPPGLLYPNKDTRGGQMRKRAPTGNAT